ncbi:TPA: hypothetical protein N0F65_006321 [Lagenidium giganteum]|uniref:HTH CENPB-type domain-containing protein n=1 Tax=Lagenidium giganteum TaxID=4803 RepID=A0AAV2YQP9_9STRA|nr:TPA: hypothetical protein N0F65_006321 [Lagenidium giganteum]
MTTQRWIQSFLENHRIVLRAQIDKKQVSTKKYLELRQQVAQHLCLRKRGFNSGKFDEVTIKNVDETHFMIDFDTGKKLGFLGEKSIKYAAVVSRGEGITKVISISGGSTALVMPPMMTVFQNAILLENVSGL